MVPNKHRNSAKVHSRVTKLNRSNARISGKKLASGFNMSSKFQFKSTKQLYKPICKKNGATLNGTKNNTEKPSREASCSNPFNALRLVENDDVLGANGGNSLRAKNVVDEGQKADAEPI